MLFFDVSVSVTGVQLCTITRHSCVPQVPVLEDVFELGQELSQDISDMFDSF